MGTAWWVSKTSSSCNQPPGHQGSVTTLPGQCYLNDKGQGEGNDQRPRKDTTYSQVRTAPHQVGRSHLDGSLLFLHMLTSFSGLPLLSAMGFSSTDRLNSPDSYCQ